MGERLFAEDRNRWRIILELSKELSIPNLIIWWQDGNSDKFMTGCVAHVNSKSGLEIGGVSLSFHQLKSKLSAMIPERSETVYGS